MPYSMAVFEWSSKDLILYQSILMAPMGLFSLGFSFVYIRFNLVKKIPERLALIFGLGIFFLFYFMTFPWWFLSSTIPYAHEVGAPVYFSQQEGIASLAALNQTGELVGCNVAYSWCESTKRVNLIVFAIFAIVALGLAMPISSINLDILYSKVLGPIKQGVWQGVLQAAGQLINIVGPILVTLVYTASGPFYLWIFELIVTGICILLCVIFYPRLISYSVRMEKELEKRKLTKIVT
uniref:Major facilitator superfamily (MFS) profile domain-containing protein n=1 Tax=Panagrolaimus sp. ES5 TaxID=591445 RepID=A0AC34F9G7_9BILA